MSCLPSQCGGGRIHVRPSRKWCAHGQRGPERLLRLARSDRDHHDLLDLAGLLQPNRLIAIFTLASSTAEPSAFTRTFTFASATRLTGTRTFMAPITFQTCCNRNASMGVLRLRPAICALAIATSALELETAVDRERLAGDVGGVLG